MQWKGSVAWRQWNVDGRQGKIVETHRKVDGRQRKISERKWKGMGKAVARRWKGGGKGGVSQSGSQSCAKGTANENVIMSW